MKKTIFTLLFATIYVCAFSQGSKQIYESPKLKEEIKKHKTVAILPLRVSISYKKFPKGLSASDVTKMEQEEGVNMQQGMYTYLLRKSKNYTVTFQDVDRTNALLKQSNLYDKINEITADSICKILKVDAVIKSTYAYEKTGSEAGAIAKTLVFGFGGSTASGALTMQIYKATDGELLWRFYKEMNEGAFSSANELMERMMKKIARNFPYEK